LWTSRKGRHLTQAVEWLERQGLIFDSVNERPNETAENFSRKIWADLYLDDKAITPENFITLHAKNPLKEITQ
jgi:hypothetical protein